MKYIWQNNIINKIKVQAFSLWPEYAELSFTQ